MRVPYLLSDYGYILRRIVKVGSDSLLKAENALLVISEIAQQLKKAGISAELQEITHVETA